MKKMQGQVQPGNEKEPRQSSDWHAAAPRQEESETPLPFLYGNSRGQDCGSPPVPRLIAVGDAQATYGYEHPDGYFARVSLTLVGAPDDDGRRARLVRDMLWDRLRPDRGDTGPAARVPDHKPPPVLEGGAAAVIEDPEQDFLAA